MDWLTDEPPPTSVLNGTAEAAPVGENGRPSTARMPAPRRLDLRGDTRGYMLRRLLVVADVAALAFAFFLVQLYGGFGGGTNSSLLLDFALLAVSAPVWIVLARAHSLYHVDTRRADHATADEVAPILQLTTLWCWAVLLLASATGLRDFSLPALVLFWGLIFLLLLALRAAIRAWARRQTWYLQNALVVGTAEESTALAEKILRHPEYGINLAACLELSGDGMASDAGVNEAQPVRSLGPIPLIRGDVDVAKLIDELDVDRVVLGSSVGALGERTGLVCELSQLAIHLDVVPGWGEVMGSRLELHEMEGMPLLTPFLPSSCPGRRFCSSGRSTWRSPTSRSTVVPPSTDYSRSPRTRDELLSQELFETQVLVSRQPCSPPRGSPRAERTSCRRIAHLACRLRFKSVGPDADIEHHCTFGRLRRANRLAFYGDSLAVDR